MKSRPDELRGVILDIIDKEHSRYKVAVAIADWHVKRIREAEIKARLVELDLLEQALNRDYQDYNMSDYQHRRLQDLTNRLDSFAKPEEKL